MSNERNAFRAGYERLYDTCPRGYIVETGEYTNDHAAHAWLWFQKGAEWQRSQSAPAGYRMVPVELLERACKRMNDMMQGDIEDQLLALLAAAPKADVQCPAYSERIVPAPTALIQWAWEDEPESTLFDEGYNAARRWVRMQIEYAVSKAPQPVSDDARDGLVDAVEDVLDHLNDGHSIHSGTGLHSCLQAAYRAAIGSKGDE